MVLKALKALKSLSATDVVRSQYQELLLKERDFSAWLWQQAAPTYAV